MLRQLIWVAGISIIFPGMAMAYAGPGMGLGVIASVLGVVAAFFMALIALLWFPLKRMFSKRKPATSSGDDGTQ